jgi:hypothetical protein
MKQELTELEALKKNTKLKPLEKIEQLRKIGTSFDAKVTPFLDPAQRQKFQALREETRKRVAEKIASKIAEAAENEAHKIW